MKSPPPLGPHLISLELLRERVPSFDEYPFNLAAVRNLHALDFHPKVTFFVGENGSGKSTLLEAIAVNRGLNAEGGSHNFRFQTRESHSQLERYLRLSKGILSPRDLFFLRAESFYNVATEIDRVGVANGYGGKSLHEQSHGEAFFALFEHRFRGTGLYFLDEPESALSPNRQMSFLSLLHQYCETGGQFVIATHSPIILAYPHATIYQFTPDGIRHVPYQATEHYQVTKSFLTHTERMLNVLLAPPS